MYPILFKIGEYTIYTYSFAIVCILTICTILVLRSIPKDILSHFDIYNFCLITLLSIMIGSKFIAFLNVGNFSFASFLKIFRLWEKSNVSSYPTLFFTISLILLYCRVRNIPSLRTLDFLLPNAVLGLGLQRIFGCFAAGCCHGTPTEMPWGVYLSEMSQAGKNFSNVPVHPTQIYYGIGTLIIYYLLITKKELLKKIDGFTTAIAMTGISSVYFIVTFFRWNLNTETTSIYLTQGQWFSLVIFTLFICFILHTIYTKYRLVTKCLE